MLIIFANCYFGDRITRKSFKFANIVYLSNWYKLPIETQMAIKLVIMRSQRPVFLNGFGLFFCSLTLFQTVYFHYEQIEHTLINYKLLSISSLSLKPYRSFLYSSRCRNDLSVVRRRNHWWCQDTHQHFEAQGAYNDNICEQSVEKSNSRQLK